MPAMCPRFFSFILLAALVVCGVNAWPWSEKVEADKVCALCKDTLVAVSAVIPSLNQDEANTALNEARTGCQNNIVQQLHLGDICNRFINELLQPLLSQAVKDNRFDPEVDCHLITACK
ncbi:hypothetical protein M3Y99_01500000 [Aphelenchoides fujianensis]|nr:hypothetical protein M3Y99_01500000 [Aphelenchoides fujianensis]